MNKQKFLTDLDLALHWYLPQPEADEILADYQEMAASAEDDCPLLQENPKAIAQSLSNRGEHRRWLLFMGLLLICPLAASFYFLFNFQNSIFWVSGSVVELLAIPSLLLPLGNLFFVKRLGQKPARPRPALWLGLLFLAAIVLLGWLSAHWLLQAAQGNFIFPAQSLLVILCICGLISIVVCIYSLVQCRLRSCRWLTVYGLALTLILGLVMVLTILTNMSFSSDINLLQRLIWELIYIGEVMWAGCALSLANWF